MDEDQLRSDSEVLNRIRELSLLGAPFGEIGYAPQEPAGQPREVDETPDTLSLATGLLDDHRQPLASDSSLYALFAHARRWQDTWDDSQHASFWSGALGLWPRGTGGKYSHMEALAYVIVIATERGLTLEPFLQSLGDELERRQRPRGPSKTRWTIKDLERLRVLQIAIQMIKNPRHGYLENFRLPRVLADEDDEFADPWLAVAHVPLEVHTKAGDASGEIVRAGLLAVERLSSRR